jgi:protein SCO1/2
VLNQLPSEPGKEYLILAVSFDETEKPPLAYAKKKMYLKMIEKPFPEEAWGFLTGEQENIRNLTEAIGFHFRREGKNSHRMGKSPGIFTAPIFSPLT